MSDILNTNKRIDASLLDKEWVDPDEKQSALQTALYMISKNQPFFGTILSSLDIEYIHFIPTAGVTFDNNGKKWKMYINPFFFCKKLSAENRIAVLMHELYHLTHKHLMRAPLIRVNPNRRQLMNIAMDMAINQYIKDLPHGCAQCPTKDEIVSGACCESELCPGHAIDVADYFDEDRGKKMPWPLNKPFEFYYHKLIERFKDIDETTSGVQGEFDSHQWDESGHDNINDMMDATEELVKRSMQKRGLDYSKLPGFIQDLLTDIEARRRELNYKQLLLSAIKRHASGINREHTWSRPSRRYGLIAPGSKTGNLPKLRTMIDSSGSISVEEANEFLDIVDEFLKVGSRKCQLSLWHTEIYYNEPYKLNTRLDRNIFQSGGTNVEPVLRSILERRSDLTIILTDGCYDNVEYEQWLKHGEVFPQILWIISRDGTENHPLKRLGETILIPNTQKLKDDSL